MGALTIATWNVNSVRLRAGLVERLLREAAPTVLCLQETKARVEQIPFGRFADLGYTHHVARGEPGYNGVAILARAPLEDAGSLDFCRKGDARHVAARVALDGAPPLLIHNLYVPAGGDEPDRQTNPKFDHKLEFVAEMEKVFAAGSPQAPEMSVLAGDFNIAPRENDVWSHRQLLNVVSHTPVEVAALAAAQARGGWVDSTRRFTPDNEKLYSWWSYRARDWTATDRGRRLDHIWLSPALAARLEAGWIWRDPRGWERPSDHAPVFARLAPS